MNRSLNIEYIVFGLLVFGLMYPLEFNTHKYHMKNPTQYLKLFLTSLVSNRNWSQEAK